MKRNLLKSVISVLLVFMLAVSFTACAKSGKTSDQSASQSTAQQTTEEKKEPVTIKATTTLFGAEANASVFADIRKSFGEKYKDKIILEVEEIPSANYADKLKVYVSSDQLPDYIANAGFNMLDLGVVEAGKLVDLTPYLDANPEFKSDVSASNLEFNSRNGKVYGLPYYSAVWGYLYNKEIFEKAGLPGPAKTWDEFWADCDKIKAAGYVPLAIDTEGWPTSLLLGAIIATEGGEEGKAFMNSAITKVKDFNKPFVIDAVKKIQTAFQKYTTKDAIGGKYDNSSNNFLSGKCAMIFNGGWMEGEIKDTTRAQPGLHEKVGVALYPGDTKTVASIMGDYLGSKTKEKADAAWEFMMFAMSPEYQLKHFETAGWIPESPKVVFTDEIKQKNAFMVNLIELCKTAKNQFAPHDNIMYTNAMDELPRLYPELATGKITAEDFCKRLTEVSQKN